LPSEAAAAPFGYPWVLGSHARQELQSRNSRWPCWPALRQSSPTSPFQPAMLGALDGSPFVAAQTILAKIGGDFCRAGNVLPTRVLIWWAASCPPHPSWKPLWYWFASKTTRQYQGRRAHSKRSAVRRMLHATIPNICRGKGKLNRSMSFLPALQPALALPPSLACKPHPDWLAGRCLACPTAPESPPAVSLCIHAAGWRRWRRRCRIRRPGPGALPAVRRRPDIRALRYAGWLASVAKLKAA
jgi:hypothetical protein